MADWFMAHPNKISAYHLVVDVLNQTLRSMVPESTVAEPWHEKLPVGNVPRRIATNFWKPPTKQKVSEIVVRKVFSSHQQAARVASHALALDVSRGVDEAIVDVILGEEASMEGSSDMEWLEQPSFASQVIFEASDQIFDCLLGELVEELNLIDKIRQSRQRKASQPIETTAKREPRKGRASSLRRNSFNKDNDLLGPVMSPSSETNPAATTTVPGFRPYRSSFGANLSPRGSLSGAGAFSFGGDLYGAPSPRTTSTSSDPNKWPSLTGSRGNSSGLSSLSGLPGLPSMRR
jgi:hypothetical protein